MATSDALGTLHATTGCVQEMLRPQAPDRVSIVGTVGKVFAQATVTPQTMPPGFKSAFEFLSVGDIVAVALVVPVTQNALCNGGGYIT